MGGGVGRVVAGETVRGAGAGEIMAGETAGCSVVFPAGRRPVHPAERRTSITRIPGYSRKTFLSIISP
jgi:hypothetical protein